VATAVERVLEIQALQPITPLNKMKQVTLVMTATTEAIE
jgi:hypothetical protein